MGTSQKLPSWESLSRVWAGGWGWVFHILFSPSLKGAKYRKPKILSITTIFNQNQIPNYSISTLTSFSNSQINQSSNQPIVTLNHWYIVTLFHFHIIPFSNQPIFKLTHWYMNPFLFTLFSFLFTFGFCLFQWTVTVVKL